MLNKLKQLLKELESITQEDINNNLNSFVNRNSIIETIETRIKMIINEQENAINTKQ